MQSNQTDILDIPTFINQLLPFEIYLNATRDILNNAFRTCFKGVPDLFETLVNFNYLVIQSTRVNITEYTIHCMFTCRIMGGKFLEITNVCTPKAQRGNRFGRTTLEHFIQYWENGPRRNLPIVLWVDRSSKYWKIAFNMYESLGFRQPSSLVEKNAIQEIYGTAYEKYTFLILTKTGAIQVIRQTFQTNLYRKLFISKNSLTDIILSKIRYIQSNNQFYTPLDVSRDRQKIFIGQNLRLRPITHRNLDGLYICFSSQVQHQENFLNETLVASPNYKILLINFWLVEVHYIQDVDVDVPTMIIEIKSLNNQEYKTLRNTAGEAYAVVKTMPLSLFEKQTQHANLAQISFTDLPNYILQTILDTSFNIHPQPSKSTKIVSEDLLLTKIRKHE